MLKHNKVRTTKTKKQIEKNKSITDNIFKSGLLVISSSVLFFSLIIIGFVFIKGMSGFFNPEYDLWGGGSWLFGNQYDGVTLFATGFMVINTLWTSFIAALIAVPIAVLTALFITRVAPKYLKSFFFVALSILAAIPSVVYGAFGSMVLDAGVKTIFGASPGSMLTIVITLAFMIMPTITLITTTSINSVDRNLEQSSLSLGATRNQTSFYITVRAASTGILTATILGVGRALGEATAVSMISMDPYSGPTFGLFEQIRLLTSTMLRGYNEIGEDTIQEASVFAMGMILIITILGVFLSLRTMQKISSPEYQSQKVSKKITTIKNIENDVKKYGLENLPIKNQKKWNTLQMNNKINRELDVYYHNQYKKQQLINKTTINTTNEKQKEKKSKLIGGITLGTALVGIVFLISIILFLLILGTSSLSWDFISSNNIIDDENSINGIQSAIFGTIVLIIISMALIIPLGVGTGIYFTIFAGDTKFKRYLLLSIDILAGVPSLIFGLVGAALFLPLSLKIGFAPLAGSIILTLIVVPTVIQTTREAIMSVPKEITTASLALGSTKTTSSLRISLPSAMPQIIGGLVLSIGRIIGESAAIVMIFGTTQRSSNSDWLTNGGTTLATEMYNLTLQEVIQWNYVAAVGLVIVGIILILALMSSYISNKNLIGSIGILTSIILLIIGIFVSSGIGLLIFMIGILIFFITIFIVTIKNIKMWRIIK